MKPKLYVDFDGVILDTINEAFSMMDELGLDHTNRREVDYFFTHSVDFEKLFNRSRIINDSVDKVKYLQACNEFQEVCILTKLSGNYGEERVKRGFLHDNLSEIRVITLAYNLFKDCVVNAEGNILVDDEMRNITRWNNARGIGIHFLQGECDLKHDIVSDLIDIVNTDGAKRLLKTRK